MIQNPQELEATLNRIDVFKNKLKNFKRLKPLRAIISYPWVDFLP